MDMMEMIIRMGEVAKVKPSVRYTHRIIQGMSSRLGMCFANSGSATNTSPTTIRKTPSRVNGVKLSIANQFNRDDIGLKFTEKRE